MCGAQAKLNAACTRLETEARAEAEVARPGYEAKRAAYEARTGRRGRPPKSPEDAPPSECQSNLTDPDCALIRRSDALECDQACNAQAVVCAEASQLVLATGIVGTPADAPSFAATILGTKHGIGLPSTVLADTGFASGQTVSALQAKGIEPLVATGRTQPHRAYDFRLPLQPKTARRITEPWRLAMLEKLETPNAKATTPVPSIPSSPSLVSSSQPSVSPAFTFAVSLRSPANGPSSLSLTTATGCTACG